MENSTPKMYKKNWLIIGISGATCSGKTTLVNTIKKNLSGCTVLHQDDYFLPADDARHTKIPELNHMNWEVLTSLDMDKMYQDILHTITPPLSENRDQSICNKKILIVEGFRFFGYKAISDLCDLRYFITLTKEQCWERRKPRIYDPPDVPGYFEKVVWPEYLSHESELKKNKVLYDSIKFINGMKNKQEIFEIVFNEIKEHLY